MHIGISPEGPDVIGFAHVKSNWSEKGGTLLYKLIQGSKFEVPKLKWVGTADYSAEALDPIQSVGRPKAEPHLSDILREVLGDGSLGIVAIRRAVEARGVKVSKSTINRELRFIADCAGKGSKSCWHLK
jgi:hypothetical protein